MNVNVDTASSSVPWNNIFNIMCMVRNLSHDTYDQLVYQEQQMTVIFEQAQQSAAANMFAENVSRASGRLAFLLAAQGSLDHQVPVHIQLLLINLILDVLFCDQLERRHSFHERFLEHYF